MLNYSEACARNQQPIYQALADNGKTDWANAVYAQARPNYHAISYGTIDDILGWEE